MIPQTVTLAKKEKHDEKLLGLVLFVAVTILSFSACYLASHCWAVPRCSHKGGLCSFEMNPTTRCIHTHATLSIRVKDEDHSGTYAPTGSTYGWEQSWRVMRWVRNGTPCGVGGTSPCN